jgi:signal transduction histidine kinase
VSALHLVTGGLVALELLVTLPMALAYIAQPLGISAEAFRALRLGPFDEHETLWLSLVGVVLLAGLGALAAMMAPVLLGPSAERIAALEAKAGQPAERDRLARELHDSVGHALTVTTLQAAACAALARRRSGLRARRAGDH